MTSFTSIPGDSDDARAIRTRDALASALITLMDGRDYNEISVQQICDRAQVGRSTFYAHFADKDEMYVRHIVVFGRRMGEMLTFDSARAAYRFPVASMFDHVRQMRPMLESLKKANKAEFVMKVWQNNLAEVFEQRIAAARDGGAAVDVPTARVPQAIMAQQLAGTFMTLLVWWMDHHYPHGAPEMEQQWDHLVKGLR